MNNTLNSLRYQHKALRVASTGLDLNVLAFMNTFGGISQSMRRELEKQETLLAGLDADMEIVSRVKIHAEFMSPAAGEAVEGERMWTLGDYASDVKVKEVVETCAMTHRNLRLMFTRVEEAIARLNRETDEVRIAASAIGYTRFQPRETLLKASIGLSQTRKCAGDDHRRHSRRSRKRRRV